MNSVPLTQAKARLSELVQKALAGEPTQITVRGKPVAQITTLERPRKLIDVQALRRLTDSMSGPEVSSEDWIWTLRDERAISLSLDTSGLVTALSKETATCGCRRGSPSRHPNRSWSATGW